MSILKIYIYIYFIGTCNHLCVYVEAERGRERERERERESEPTRINAPRTRRSARDLRYRSCATQGALLRASYSAFLKNLMLLRQG